MNQKSHLTGPQGDSPSQRLARRALAAGVALWKAVVDMKSAEARSRYLAAAANAFTAAGALPEALDAVTRGNRIVETELDGVEQEQSREMYKALKTKIVAHQRKRLEQNGTDNRFAEALARARTVRNPVDRVWALQDICQEAMEAGERSVVESIVQEMGKVDYAAQKDPELKWLMMTAFTTALLYVGQLSEAEDVMRGIGPMTGDNDRRHWGAAAAASGALDFARRLAAEVKSEPAAAGHIYAAIAKREFQDRRGTQGREAIVQGMTIVRTSSQPLIQAYAIMDLAASFARVDAEEARRIYQEAIVSADRFGGALGFDAIASIAVEIARLGESEEAFAIASRIDSPDMRAVAFFGMATMWFQLPIQDSNHEL